MKAAEKHYLLCIEKPASPTDKSGWDKWNAALSELKHAAARIEGVFNPVENVFVTPTAPPVDSGRYITELAIICHEKHLQFRLFSTLDLREFHCD